MGAGEREVKALLMLAAVGLNGSALGQPFFSLLPFSQARSCKGQPRL